jgi:hypothetical protein
LKIPPNRVYGSVNAKAIVDVYVRIGICSVYSYTMIF